MRFRTRLLVAFALIGLGPLVAFTLGVRQRLADRLTEGYQERVTALVRVIESDLERQSDEIARRLATLADALRGDNRFRLAAVEGLPSQRRYLLDYSGEAMRVSGLDMLQIQDDDGRILSSGHFRAEYDRRDPAIIHLLEDLSGAAALVEARSPEGPLLALTRIDSVRLGGRRFTLVGGVSVDRVLLHRLSRESELAVSLIYPGGAISSDTTLQGELQRRMNGDTSASPETDPVTIPDAMVEKLNLPYLAPRGPDRVRSASFVVSHSLAPLHELLRTMNLWLGAAVTAAALAALLGAAWLSSRISRPLSALADKARRLDLDQLDVGFETERTDEIGALSRVLNAMTERLRTSARNLRDAERRAAIGDLARQVNHDIKNGLTPLRNVFRHLSQIARDEPESAAHILRERSDTIESSISYLGTLAANYDRLARRPEPRPTDVNAVAHDVIASSPADPEARLTDGLPRVSCDPLLLRRVLENLTANALESLESADGSVTVATELAGDGRTVRITVQDTGRGIPEDERTHIFEDFYTTKTTGTGLGLSIVRRLVRDMNGTVRVESEPGRGSRFTVELPALDPESQRTP